MNTRTLGRPARLDRSRAAVERRAPWTQSSLWPWAKRFLTLAFFALVALLITRYARNVDWDEVWAAVADTPMPALLLAFGLAAASHFLYSCFDLVGRHYTGHGLRTATVMAVNFISYAFNLTLGALVGGVAFRYRLYSRLGLNNGVITRVVTMSMLTNWLGYMLLGGLLFILHPLALPPSWRMGNHGLQWIGLLMVGIAVGYLVACARMGGRRREIRGHELCLPTFGVGALQLAMSCINWSIMGGVVFVLLQPQVPYADVLTALLVAAIAGVVAHVPAGLGVFEFIFVALLSHQAPEGRLLAALLGYRAVYYLVPALTALALYLGFEFNARNVAPHAGSLKAAG